MRGFTLTLTANVIAGQFPTTEVHFYWDADGNGVLDPNIDTDIGHDSNSSGGWTLRFSTAGYPLGPNVFFARAEDGQAHSDYIIAKTIVALTGPDTENPSATLLPTLGVTIPGGTEYGFQVLYEDDVAIALSELGDGDVQVVGLDGSFAELGIFVNVDLPSDGSPRTVTYQITPPGGSWDVGDNGTYRISVRNNQVSDTSAHYFSFGQLGTFTVNIADTTSPFVTLDSLSTDINSPSIKSVNSFSASGSASDPDSSIVSDQYHFFLSSFGGGVWGEPVDLGAGGPSITLDSLSEGLHALALQAENGASLTASSPNGFFNVDTTPPTAMLDIVSPNPRNSPVSTLNITFSEPVFGFDLGDLTLKLDGGSNLLTASQTLTSSDNVTWVLGDLSSLTAVTGSYELQLTVGGAGIQDAAMNPLAADATEMWSVDSTPPTTTRFMRLSPPTSPTSADTLVFRVTFNEAVTGVDAVDFAVTGTTAAVTDVSTVSSTVYDVTVSGGNLASLNATVGLDFAGTVTIADMVGNPLPTTEPTIDETYTVVNVVQISSVIATATGFVVDVDSILDVTLLNLYDSQAGTFGSADMTLVGNTTGAVRGSLILSADQRQATFIATGGPLAPDTYTLTLRSGDNGFRDTAGNLLDGNSDGTPGDDYTTTFVVTNGPANEVLVSVPDFTRGYGQSVNLPSNADAGLPITLSTGQNVTKVEFDLVYDSALLTITDFSTSIPGAVSTFSSPSTGVVHVSVRQRSRV